MEKEAGVRYPVVTLVLYFGHKKHWNQPKSLLECGRMEDIRRATEDRAYRQKLMEELKITL